MNDIISYVKGENSLDIVSEKDIEKTAEELTTCQTIIHRLDNLDNITWDS